MNLPNKCMRYRIYENPEGASLFSILFPHSSLCHSCNCRRSIRQRCEVCTDSWVVCFTCFRSTTNCSNGDRELIEHGFALPASVREGLRLDGQDRARQTWERDVEILAHHQHVVGGKKVTTHFERL